MLNWLWIILWTFLALLYALIIPREHFGNVMAVYLIGLVTGQKVTMIFSDRLISLQRDVISNQEVLLTRNHLLVNQLQDQIVALSQTLSNEESEADNGSVLQD